MRSADFEEEISPQRAQSAQRRKRMGKFGLEIRKTLPNPTSVFSVLSVVKFFSAPSDIGCLAFDV